jgi:hypothetical protein
MLIRTPAVSSSSRNPALVNYSLRVFSPAGAVEVNSSSKTGVDATIW